MSPRAWGMATLISLGFAAQSATAQDKTYPVFMCENGKVIRSSVEHTLLEMTILFKRPTMVPARPDYGRFLFANFGLVPQGSEDVSWERTSTMAKKCREEHACGGGQGTGRQVATLAGPATAGGAGEAGMCEEQFSVTVAKCGPGGALQTQVMTGTADQIRSFTGADPSVAAGRILYEPGASSGAGTEWRQATTAQLSKECSEQENEPKDVLFWDGTWTIRMVDEQFSDCPAQAVAMGRGAGAIGMTPRAVRWSSPPHPTDLLPETRQLGAWQGRDRSWRLRFEHNPGGGASAPIKVNVGYSFEGRMLDHIRIKGRLQVRAAPELAKMAGFGGHCIYDMDAIAERTGP